uniref:Uncharacterized protein n=1 Tax=Falco tinnunculus TaxID=100819 RepID=A0A8C4UG26_FALTI
MQAAGLLLAWALLRPAGAQQCHLASPGNVLRFTDMHAEIRVPALHRVPSSLDPLYGLVRRCLDLIQQNPLPTELLRTALNDPSSVRMSQVSWDVGWENPTGMAPGGSALHRGHAGGRDVLLLLPEPPAVWGPPACPPALAGLPPPLPASLPVPHVPHHPVSPPKYPKETAPSPWVGGTVSYRAGRLCRAAPHRLLTPGRISVVCAFVTSQRVKWQLELGLGAVPTTLRTLRQHIDNVPQVGP